MAIGATIPANLIQRIIPLLMKQSEQLSDIATKFTDKVMQLNSKTKCSDPQVAQLKSDLQKIYQLITTIKQGLNSINNIVPVITTISTVAKILKTVQLVIPSVPGVPSGPVTELINTFDNLGTNAKSSTASLKGLISSVNSRLDLINKSLAVAIDKLASICNSDTFNVTADIAAELDAINLDYDSLAPTQFYTILNVSDDDLENRIAIIQDLLQQQLNILQNLKEAPSKVIAGVLTPSVDTGDINDYYISTDEEKIYGPKTSIGWGVGINI
jgi:transcriptional regulator of heat shock response